ncbi:zinc finger BED domain-containing protein 4-like, partial [Aphis craccivora]
MQEYGSFIKLKSRVSTVINVDNSFSVLVKLIENPHISLRTVADDIPILLENILLQQRLNLIWQQDGAPAHNTLAVRTYLNKMYGDNNWFGTQSPIIQWPRRSPDLSVLDFFFWGHLKNEVYKEKCNSVEELKQRIRDCCNKV